MSFSVMRQHSDPYSRVERTQLLYNFNFVCVLYCCDFHTGLSILKAFLALPILMMMSLPAPPSCLTVLPRYVNCLLHLVLLNLLSKDLHPSFLVLNSCGAIHVVDQLNVAKEGCLTKVNVLQGGGETNHRP